MFKKGMMKFLQQFSLFHRMMSMLSFRFNTQFKSSKEGVSSQTGKFRGNFGKIVIFAPSFDTYHCRESESSVWIHIHIKHFINPQDLT